MENAHGHERYQGFEMPEVRRVGITAPIEWIRKGWGDMLRAPAASLFYGLVFVVAGYALHFLFLESPAMMLGLVTGFLLVGPFLAIGLYEISRRLERGDEAPLTSTLTAWRRNITQISLFSVILLIAMVLWIRGSLLVFALFFDDTSMPTVASFMSFLTSREHLDFLIAYFAIGAAFAGVVFAVSAISIPMMLDRDVDTMTASIASFSAVARNGAAMTLWAALIVALVAAGFATFYLGLALAVPVVGHATWHAYRDLVGHP